MNYHAECGKRPSLVTAFLTITMIAASVSSQAKTESKGRRPPVLHGSFARVSWPEHHLYVLDVNSPAVYRFPLAYDGLPATQPDSMLTLEGAQEPYGLTVDRSGHIFVSDVAAGVVNKYAAGAVGPQKPISILNLPNDAPDFLKMDAAERLYVHYGAGSQNESIAIFAKGAHGSDLPISVVPPFYSPELASDYVITQSGVLYILDISHGAGILGYNNPIDDPSAPDTFIWPQGGWEFDFFYTLALDDAMDSLYVQFLSRSQYEWNKTNFGVRLLNGSGGAALDRLIFNGQCGTMQWSGTGGSLIVKDYLMVSCLADPKILVFRKAQSGKRHAVEIVGKGMLQGVAQIAVGP